MTENNKFKKNLKEAAGLIPHESVLEPCPKCRGERVKAEVSQTYLIPYIPYKVSGWSYKYTKMDAVVCTACGYTEVYARQPLNLVIKRPDRKIEDYDE